MMTVSPRGDKMKNWEIMRTLWFYCCFLTPCSLRMINATELCTTMTVGMNKATVAMAIYTSFKGIGSSWPNTVSFIGAKDGDT